MKITAPWSDDIAARLNRWQTCGHYHEYTCVECDSVLKATIDGLVCEADGCTYEQNWAHDPMTNEQFDLVDNGFVVDPSKGK